MKVYVVMYLGLDQDVEAIFKNKEDAEKFMKECGEEDHSVEEYEVIE